MLKVPRVPRRGSLPAGIKESDGDNRLDVFGPVHIVHDRRLVSSRGFADHIRSGRSRGRFVQSADNCFRIAVDYRQQDTSRTIRDASSLFPILDSPGIEPKPIREFLAAQLHAFAQSHYVLRGGIVDDTGWKYRFASHMSEHFGKSCFQLTSQLGSGRHRSAQRSLRSPPVPGITGAAPGSATMAASMARRSSSDISLRMARS